MKLSDLVTEFASVRAPGWLVLDGPELLQCGIEATRYYAAYGDIKSLSGSDPLPAAAGLPDPIIYPPMLAMTDAGSLPDGIYAIPASGTEIVDAGPIVADALPIKAIEMITADTVLSVGEWAIIRPLFVLYVERDNAARLEASRALGLEVYGRSVSEITGDIHTMENDTLPARAFCAVSFEV